MAFMKFFPFFTPFVGFGAFSAFILFFRPLSDPAPFLFFLFSEVSAFNLVPLDRDRFAVVIAQRSTAFFIVFSLFSVVFCVFTTFSNRFSHTETYLFWTCIFSVFFGFIFSVTIWVFDLRFLPFTIYPYSSNVLSAGFLNERRDLPTTLDSRLSDFYDGYVVFSSIFLVFPLALSYLSFKNAYSRWLLRSTLCFATFYFFGGEGLHSDLVVLLFTRLGSERWLIYFSFFSNLLHSTYSN